MWLPKRARLARGEEKPDRETENYGLVARDLKVKGAGAGAARPPKPAFRIAFTGGGFNGSRGHPRRLAFDPYE